MNTDVWGCTGCVASAEAHWEVASAVMRPKRAGLETPFEFSSGWRR